MQKYTEIIISLYPFVIGVLSVFMLIYSRLKGIKEELYLAFWKGTLLFSLSMLIPKLHVLVPNAPWFTRTLTIISYIPFLYGSYLLWQVIKTDKRELIRNAAFGFGLLSLILVPISALVALGLLFDSIVDSKQKWQPMLAIVFSGTLSVFLAVVGWRLFKIRKGWTGSLLTPYSLWLQLPAYLFLVTGFIKLIQRNLIGLWAIALAVALLVLSYKKEITKKNLSI